MRLLLVTEDIDDLSYISKSIKNIETNYINLGLTSNVPTPYWQYVGIIYSGSTPAKEEIEQLLNDNDIVIQ